jgi:predicted site-specific integrase-resolvase
MNAGHSHVADDRVPDDVVRMAPLFLRRRDTAAACAVSESVILQWERAGLLTPVKLPGLRSIRHATEEVQALVGRIRRGEFA